MILAYLSAVALGLSCLATVQGAAPWWQALGPVTKGEYGGGFTDKEPPPEHREVLALTQFPEWVSYEDDFVKLRYPKNPYISFHVAGEGEYVKIEGGAVGTTDNSFQRAYTLKVGGVTYGVFLLAPATWLDDGICLCGPMVYHSCSMREGALVRYSMLPGGALKKAQVLGQGLRLTAFEWTHLACPREIYEAMADSMVVKAPLLRTEQQLRAEITRRYGWAGQAAWLHPGIARQQAVALLGTPAEEESTENRVVWQQLHRDYLCRIEAEFQDGLFVRVAGERVIRPVSRDPVAGTLSWVTSFTTDLRDDEEDENADTSGRPSTEALQTALRDLHPGCHGERWREWCEALAWLQDNRDVKAKDLVAVVAGRSRGRACELEVLAGADHPELAAWVTAGLKTLSALSPVSPEQEDEGDPDLEWSWRLPTDAAALLGWQLQNDAGSFPASVSMLLDRSHPVWTSAVLDHAKELEPPLATRAALQGLEISEKRKDMELLEKVLESLELLEPDRPQAIREAVVKLPEGKPGSSWSTKRAEALKTLEQKAAVREDR